MTNFKELKIWQRGMEIASLVFNVCEDISGKDIYTIRSQVVRAGTSIPSNIGASRKSNKDFRRFLEISLGSCFEPETQMILIKKNGLISNAKV